MTIRWVEREPWYKEVQELMKAANDDKLGAGRALVQGGAGVQEEANDCKVGGVRALV
jgi:hypothetical protein